MSCTKLRIAGLLSAVLLMAPLSTAYAADQNATQPAAPNAGPVNSGETPAAPTHPAHHKAQKKPTPLVLPPLPAGPLQQVPMTQLPAAAPRVTYQNGMLAIAAQNSTLGEILRDVRKLTGASVDMPQSASSERVVAQVGPGAPRDVLALLLNGTSFNYVMLGSAANPSAVASIALSVKPGGEVQTAAASNNPGYQTTNEPRPVMPGRFPQPFRPQPPGMIQPNNGPPAGADAAAEDNSDDSDTSTADDDSSDQSQQVQPGVVQPDQNAQPDQQEPNQPNNGPKTPEQLLQMMRQAQPPGAPNGPVNIPPNVQPPEE